jgi:TrmH family RNA methyltransferase
MKITSADNPRFKDLKKLFLDKEFRHLTQLYPVEGLRAASALLKIEQLYIRAGTQCELKCQKIFEVEEKLFDKIADTQTSQGIIALCAMTMLDKSAMEKDKRYLFLDRVQDPGNMGTIIRTACAFGIEGVIIDKGCCDPFAPKVVRSSGGYVGRIKIIQISKVSELEGHSLICADFTGEDPEKFIWPKGFILAIGNEANGVSEEILNLPCHRIFIPTKTVESLNVAIAAGILLFQASRS